VVTPHSHQKYIRKRIPHQILILKMKCKPEDKESTGCSQYPTMNGYPTFRRASFGSEDNWNAEAIQGTSTGRLFAQQLQRSRSPELNSFSENPATQNLQDLKRQQRTFGKKKLVSKTLSSSSEINLSNEQTPKTGSASGSMPNEENLCQSLQTFEFRVTGLSEQSALTTLNLFRWSECAIATGVQLALASQDLLGVKPDWELIVKIRTQNSGVVTAVKNLLYSMNFVVESTSRTFSAGWIVTRAMWKSKDQVSHYVRNPFGLRPTFHLNNGIQN